MAEPEQVTQPLQYVDIRGFRARWARWVRSSKHLFFRVDKCRRHPLA
jgi:hypothetical protein